MIRRFFQRIMGSTRGPLAVFGNATVSIASLAVSVAVARESSIAQFAMFAMAMAVYIFGSGLIRAAFTDTALSSPDDGAVRTRSNRRASTASLVAAVLLVAWGVVAGNWHLIILGTSFHGLTALDTVRVFESAAGRARRAVAASSIWALTSILVSVLAIILALEPMLVFGAWALSGAICGYVSMIVSGLKWLPGWDGHKTENRIAGLFAGDYLVGSGGSALTTTLVSALAELSVAAAIRGAGTILGPINLISSTARSLMIPKLARIKETSDSEWQTSVRSTLVLTCVVAPPLILLQFIPTEWGTWLLGASWSVATLALLPLAIEALFALVSAVPAAGHRVSGAGRRALALRLAMGVPRPFIVLLSAQTWGVAGAAWSMAAIAVVNTVVWWISYRRLLASPRPQTDST